MSESKQRPEGLPPPDPKLSLSLSGERDVTINGDVLGRDVTVGGDVVGRDVIVGSALVPCRRLVIIAAGVLIAVLVLVGLILILTQAMPK